MPNFGDTKVLGFSKALEHSSLLDSMIGCSTSNLMSQPIHHSQSQKIQYQRRMSEPQEASE